MKKAKVISLIMALTTLFSVSAPVYAAETEAYDYSVMPISEVYDDYSTSLISEDDIMLISPNPTVVSDTISVVLNGRTIDFTDEKGNKVNPQLINNRTMVPFRKIFEVLGAEVEWNGTTQTVTAATEEKIIKLQINNNVATVMTGDKTEKIILDTAPVIIEGRTLVPVRFISESLGMKVSWEQETKTVIIMDTSIVLEIIKEEAPIFYAMLTEETTPVKTGEVDFDMTATLNYTDSEETANNSNIKLVFDGLLKLAEKAVGFDFDYKITGKGIIYDDMKAEGVDDISMETIIDMETADVYIKSPMLEIGDKWAKEVYENPEEITTITQMQETQENPDETLQAFVDALIDQMEITPATYNEIIMYTMLGCRFVSDEYFTVSGRTTKIYKYEITIEDVEKIFEGMGLGLDLDQVFSNTKLTVVSKYENGIGTEFVLKFTTNIKSDYETIEIEVDGNAVTDKINKNVTVEIPSEEDVVIIE